MPIYFTSSYARRNFKKHLGNANHLIVTILVGLDLIIQKSSDEKELLKKIPDKLHMAWSPKDISNSIGRSRRLILDMAFIRAIDALDGYIKNSLNAPYLIEPEQRRIEIRDAEGVSQRFELLEKYYKVPDKVASALVGVMLVWRNKGTHSRSKASPKAQHQKILLDSRNEEEIAKRFSGLSGELLINGYKNGQSPAFKEIASFINALHHYINSLEELQFSCFPNDEKEKEAFLKGVILQALTKGNGSSDKTVNKRLVQSVWGKDISKRKKCILNLLKYQGFSVEKPEGQRGYIEFPDYLLEPIFIKTTNSMLAWLEG